MRDAGQFDLNPRDRILFDWFVWQFGSSEESNMIDINNNIGGDLILAKDGLRNIIKEAGVQTLRDYLQAGGSLLDGASPDEFRLGRRPILIHDAIKFNNPDIVSLLLDEGFSPNDRNASLGETAYLNLWSRLANFQEGVDRGKGIELLQRMRQMGADVTLPFNLDSTIFHEAVWRVPYEWLALEMPHHAQHMGLTNAWGRLPHESLEEIFSSGNNDLARTISLFNVTPHAMDCMKMTQLLMHGCRCGDMSAVELALEDGACAKRGVVVTPLFAAAHHGHAHIVQKLLDAGADWSVKEAQGRTPLMAAAKQGHVGVMKVLLDAGAAIDDMSLDGNTALVHAALLNEKEAVNFLTMKGAKVDLILSNGVRFIETAANSFVKAEVISTLVKKLGQQLDSFAFEVILNRSKDAAIKKQKSEIVSVLDSALAMLYVDRVLDERRPVSRVAA